MQKVKFCQYKDSMVGNSKEGLHSDDLQTAYDTLTDSTFREQYDDFLAQVAKGRQTYEADWERLFGSGRQ